MKGEAPCNDETMQWCLRDDYVCDLVENEEAIERGS
jgi:hypothetical protein